jgi:hypothetical protein
MDIALENVCFVISKARELVTELRDIEEDTGDEQIRGDLPEDDLPNYISTPEHDELKEFIDSLSEDEQMDLIAIAWIGRGMFTAEDWDEAVETAREEHPKNAASYLVGQPLLAEELESGLEELGLECEDE